MGLGQLSLPRASVSCRGSSGVQNDVGRFVDTQYPEHEQVMCAALERLRFSMLGMLRSVAFQYNCRSVGGSDTDLHVVQV